MAIKIARDELGRKIYHIVVCDCGFNITKVSHPAKDYTTYIMCPACHKTYKMDEAGKVTSSEDK